MKTAMTMVDRIIGNAPFVYDSSFADGVARAAYFGYDGVEIHATNPLDVDVENVELTLKKYRLEVTAFGTGRAYVNEGLSLIDPDSARRKTAIERMEQFLTLAGRFHAKVIVGCMRGNVPDPAQLPAALDTLAESMQHIDRVAGDNGVTVVFEPINRYENNFLCDMASISHFLRSFWPLSIHEESETCKRGCFPHCGFPYVRCRAENRGKRCLFTRTYLKQ